MDKFWRSKMKKSFRILTIISLLILVSLACAIPGGLPTSNPLDTLGTQVAGTLTALSQFLPLETTVVPPTLVPSPATPAPPAVLRVAYVKNNNAWIWTEGGAIQQLTMTGDVYDVSLSQDGQLIAFVREVAPLTQEIWVVNNDGSNLRLLVSPADFLALYTGPAAEIPVGMSAYQLDWQPGTHNLFYNTRPLYEGPGSFGYDDLHMVNVDSLAKLTFFPGGQGGKFFFSPNGSQLAMVKPTSISLVNSDGSNLRSNLVVFPMVITYSEYLYYPSPLWASDSSSLRVVIPPADPILEPTPPYSLWFIPANGSPAVATGTIPAIPFAWPDDAISPDLNRLAYLQRTGGVNSNMRDIKLANADGSGVVWYMNGDGVQFLGWLPNSAQFVFSVQSGPEVGIHVSSLAEGYTTLSLVPYQIRSFSWLDNTHYLAFWQNGGITELRYNVLGGGSTLLDSGEIWGYDYAN
jgi:hypothetical protein